MTTFSSEYYALASLALALGLVVKFILPRLFGNQTPPPPGPKGLPVIGNLRDLPPLGNFEAHHWLKHKEQYGPISSVTVMGQTIVIINKPEIAFELLEKRSAKFSSRPRTIFAGEMLGWDNLLGLCQYGSRFRTYRKNISRIIGSNTSVATFDALQEKEVGHFLLHTLDNPDELQNHIRREAGAIILKIAYGYKVEPHKEDFLVEMVGDATDKFNRAAVRGAYLVDTMPFLRNLPDWFPGTGFKQTAKKWASELDVAREKPYDFVKQQLAQGKHNDSFLARLVEAGDEDPERKFTNKWSAMTLYTGGADTTVSSLSSFFLALTNFPEVQKRAQEEIDRVIGKDRLPTAADRPDLPYIDATIKEVLRWQPVVPMALPHASTEDDIYEGYHIPKGSILLANVWHFTHDPEVYKNPLEFNPARHLGEKAEPDPHQFVFGFGRRICPGRHLADKALFIAIAQALAVFHVSAPKEGKPEVRSTPGVVSHPEPYKAVIKPRSPRHEELIRALETKYPWEASDAQTLEALTRY